MREAKSARVAGFNISAFVSKLEGMGIKLTAVPFPDGTLRISRWAMPKAAQHADEIQDLWATVIGENRARVDLLASHLSVPVRTPPRL